MTKHNTSAPYQKAVFGNMNISHGSGRDVSFLPDLSKREEVLLFRIANVQGRYILGEPTLAKEEFVEYVREVAKQKRLFKKEGIHYSNSLEKIQIVAWQIVKAAYPEAYTD